MDAWDAGGEQLLALSRRVGDPERPLSLLVAAERLEWESSVGMRA